MTRKYDLIIFGASGYTGEWVVEECANLQKASSGFKPFTWAVAGRSERKLIETLRKVSDFVGEDLSSVDKIVADVSDDDSLKRMAAQGSVIVNCVGPYRFFGEQVVKACLDEGASHVDISGELQFLEGMQIKYHSVAEEKGVYIVGACGYDSVPGDCGVVYLQQKFDGEVNAVECYAETDSHGKPVGLHFGTWQSAIHFLANYGELRQLKKQLYTVAVPPTKYKLPWRFPLHYSKVVGGWCIPFPGVDAEIIKRTQYHLYTKEKQRPAQFKAYMKMPNLVFCIGAMIVGLMIGVLSQFKFGRYLLETYPKVFSLGLASHEGPTREGSDSVDFKFTMFANGWKEKLTEPTDQHSDAPEKKMKLVVSGKNPGYRATAAMLVQSALSIVLEKNKMPSTGGVYPPGAAFANTTIIDRCGSRGVRFTVEK